MACEVMPGFLIPSDLIRLTGDEPLDQWACKHLLASPGAIAVKDGRPFRIPTLVPRKAIWGTCHWLVEGRCAVWEDAPFACAFFTMCDVDKPRGPIEYLVQAGFVEIMQNAEMGGAYLSIWNMLWNMGPEFRAVPPEEGRARLDAREYASKSGA